MKWNKPCKFSAFLFLALGLTSCFPLSKIPTPYSSSKLSGVFIDAETGKPVEGVNVQVAWRALRRTSNEHNPDMMDIHNVTTVTDTNGAFTIPAWSRMVAIEWEYAGYPIVSYSKYGYRKGYADGLSNGARFSLTVDPYVRYGPQQSDDEINKKIKGTWTKTVNLADGYVVFTNTIGPDNSFSFLGTIFNTNGVKKGTWQAEGTWHVKYWYFVKHPNDMKVVEQNYAVSYQVLHEEHVVHVDDNILILSSDSDMTFYTLKRIN